MKTVKLFINQIDVKVGQNLCITNFYENHSINLKCIALKHKTKIADVVL